MRSAPPIRNRRAVIKRPLPRPAAHARAPRNAQNGGMRFSVPLRCTDTRSRIELSGLLRLVPVGADLPVQLGTMKPGTIVTWDGKTWQVLP